MSTSSLFLRDFDFDLPEALIAQHPVPNRADSRLLRVSRSGDFARGVFSDLPELLSPGDLLLINDTRVFRARFFGEKESGGKVEVLLERVLDARRAEAQIRASKPPREGARLFLARAFYARVTGRDDDLFALELEKESEDFWRLAERYGQTPLPPYITRLPTAEDEIRYQTVYAQNPGAVAAPTAGLHFDEALFARLAARGVQVARLTLHVGAGTFQPVRCESLAEHKMHRERYCIPAATAEAIARTREAGGKVIAVGTTSLRALESAARENGTVAAGEGETGLFITPGFRFRVVDRLITNFHLPRSTLFILVSAFAGRERIRAAYARAVAERYRFFSYGDAMLLDREAQGGAGEDAA
ncbi:MAG: tRNA preQ1(34) S-adenosylmethionine ribosyltransferase-isomerase QueA [Zoogloeaceae bacterium]|jgi:S-adenosylmethionine:tRNA ribosyltransferase-isomerase|nr:tRNA preQ1(34) S-adenosylmethionine ribosyltransferase-isomerase QueA [Zoogloeaceae bacterium]